MRAIDRRALMMEIKVTLREGSNHTIVMVGQCHTQIPRHREIANGTVASIMKDLEPEFGKRWLR